MNQSQVEFFFHMALDRKHILVACPVFPSFELEMIVEGCQGYLGSGSEMTHLNRKPALQTVERGVRMMMKMMLLTALNIGFNIFGA